jgi:hypothetical protein
MRRMCDTCEKPHMCVFQQLNKLRGVSRLGILHETMAQGLLHETDYINFTRMAYMVTEDINDK